MVTDALSGEIAPPLSRRVSAHARAHGGTRVLDVVAFVFYTLGALAFWTLLISGGTVRWCWSAVRLGWLEARESARTRGFDRWPARVSRGTG